MKTHSISLLLSILTFGFQPAFAGLMSLQNSGHYWDEQAYGLLKTTMFENDTRKIEAQPDVAMRTPIVKCRELSGEELSGTGIIANIESGVMLTAAHLFVNSRSPETKEEQLNSILDRCRIEIQNENTELIFTSKIKDFEIGDYFLPRNLKDLSSDQRVDAIIKSNEEDWIGLQLEKPFPLYIKKLAMTEVDLEENLKGLKIFSIAYHHIPDDETTTEVNEDFIGLMSDSGVIKKSNGGSNMRNSKKLVLYNANTNGMSSGAALYAMDDKRGRWDLLAMHIGSKGTDGEPFNEKRHFNIAIKFSGKIKAALLRLSGQYGEIFSAKTSSD